MLVVSALRTKCLCSTAHTLRVSPKSTLVVCSPFTRHSRSSNRLHLEVQTFAFLKAADDLEEFARLRIAVRTKHAHQALGLLGGRSPEFLKPNGRVDIVAQHRLADVDLASNESDQGIAIPSELDPVAKAEVDSVLQHAATDAVHIRQVAHLHAVKGRRHARGGLSIELVVPATKRAVATGIDELPNF